MSGSVASLCASSPLTNLCHIIMCHIGSAAAANLLTSSHPHQAHHLMACYFFFFYSLQEINRRCTPMDQLFAMLVVLLLLYTGHLIYMKMQWLNRAVGVVMTLILLNKQTVLIRHKQITASHTMGMDTSSGDKDANMTLLQTKAKKKKKNYKIKMTVHHYGWHADITPVGGKTGTS